MLKHRLCLLLATASLLSACASDPHRRPEPSAAAKDQAQQLATSGYQAAEKSSLTLALQEWIVEGERLPVSLAWPGSGRALPLIVYLPGLGESAQAGQRWRQAWARAGYAVLGVQPLEVDATAWSSELARAADFKGLARQHQRADQLSARLHRLDAALAEARRRAASGDALWSRVDFSHMAVAGYDLGSQAAMRLAPGFQAALLLSPLPSTDAPTLTGPVLLISSRRDTDPTGLLESPDLRTQAFEQMPSGGGNKYLLLLDTASHAALAGGTAPELEDFAADGKPGRQGGGGQQGGGRRKGGGGGGGGGGGKDGQDAQSRHVPTPMARADSPLAASVATESISIAFLDAHLRQRPAAERWLQNDAADWLQGLGEWRQR